jgi:hypothetical protein
MGASGTTEGESIEGFLLLHFAIKVRRHIDRKRLVRCYCFSHSHSFPSTSLLSTLFSYLCKYIYIYIYIYIYKYIYTHTYVQLGRDNLAIGYSIKE